jgi:hypothetical protein
MLSGQENTLIRGGVENILARGGGYHAERTRSAARRAMYVRRRIHVI